MYTCVGEIMDFNPINGRLLATPISGKGGYS